MSYPWNLKAFTKQSKDRWVPIEFLLTLSHILPWELGEKVPQGDSRDLGVKTETGRVRKGWERIRSRLLEGTASEAPRVQSSMSSAIPDSQWQKGNPHPSQVQTMRADMGGSPGESLENEAWSKI